MVRECQRALAERGLVSVRHGRRAIVRPEQDWDVFDPDVLTALVGGERGAHVLAEYLEARRLLEVEAAGLAAERATPEAIQRALGRVRRHARRGRARARQPRRRAALPAGRHRLPPGDHPRGRQPPAGADGGADPPRAERHLRARSLARRPRFERGLPEHARILEAIKDGDSPGARLAMREHLLTVEGYLRERTAATTPRRWRGRTGMNLSR